MAVLGNVVNLYVVLLLMFLVGGIAVIARSFASRIWEGTEKIIEKRGGRLMNKWLKIAVVSFTGLLIASFALGLTNNASAGQDSHQAHVSANANANADTGTGYNNWPVSGQPSEAQPAYNTVPVSYLQSGSPDDRMHQMQMGMMQMMVQLGQMMQMQMDNMQMDNMQMNGAGMGSGMNGMSSGMGNMGMNGGSMGMGGMNMSGQSSMNSSGGSSGGMGMM